MSKITVGELGSYIRDQRNSAQISLRQLAKLAGVSNPYLSQIERGLRRPSAEILQQIAKALRISAEVLYVQAGILDERPSNATVADSVLSDLGLNDRQKQVLLEIYDSFRRENAERPSTDPAAPEVPPTGDAPPARRRARPSRVGAAPKAVPATKPPPTKPPAGKAPRRKAG